MRRRRFNRGRWQIERERHQLPDEAPARKPHEAGIGDVVAGLLRCIGAGPNPWLRQLEDEWPRIVGEPVAAHTRPGRFDRGTLTVFVDHSIWLMELSRIGRKEMLKKVQARFPGEGIRDIRLNLDPDRGMKRP